MWVDKIGEQYTQSIILTCTYSISGYPNTTYTYIQHFSIARLQDTNLLIPSSDWSIKYLMELLSNFFQFSYFFSLICSFRKANIKIRGGKHKLFKATENIYFTTFILYQHLLVREAFKLTCRGWHYFDLDILYVTESCLGRVYLMQM